MQVERVHDSDRWNRFVTRHSGPVFDLWEWGRLCERYGHDVTYLGAAEDGDLCGVVPLVHMRSRVLGDKLVSMPYSEYGSIVLASEAPPETTSRLLASVREMADELDVAFVSLRGRDLTNAPTAGFERKRRFVTFEIGLEDGDSDAVWDALDSSRRGHVRTGRENGLTVRQATSIEDLRRYYGLYLDNMQNFGTPPHSFGFFEQLWSEFGDRMDIDLAEHDGSLVNGQIVLFSRDTCFHWGAVSDHAHRDLQGGSLLLWDSLERAAEEDYSSYSLGRTREGTGVYSFKKSWGGKKVWFDDYHYFPSGTVTLPNPDDETYDRLSDTWQRLPRRATKWIGPSIRKNISL